MTPSADGWVLRRSGETLPHPARRRRGPQRALPKDEPFYMGRRITSDGDQTAPEIPKARPASTSPAAVHALSSRALWPGCARARRRARHRGACSWARRRARRHRTLPHSLAVLRALRRCERWRRRDRLVERARWPDSQHALPECDACRHQRRRQLGHREQLVQRSVAARPPTRSASAARSLSSPRSPRRWASGCLATRPHSGPSRGSGHQDSPATFDAGQGAASPGRA